MTSRDIVGFAAGVCVASSACGACGALTSIPPIVLFATGVTLAWCSRMPRARTASPYIALGLVGGLLLPSTPPPVAGVVVTHAEGVALRGDIFDVLDRLDDDPSYVLGRRVSVSGEWTPASARRPATVSRRIMSCCAADAIAVGFDVEVARFRPRRAGDWVRVDGVVRERMVDGERRFVLEQSKVRSLEDTVSNPD